MLIALDFDDTYTRDPMFWKYFVMRAKSFKHDVVIVTFREGGLDHTKNFDVAFAASELEIDAVFTQHQPKRAYCAAIGVFPHVWVDDSPEFIVGEIQ